MNIFIIVVLMSGWASQYDPGVMERVVVNQQRWGHLHNVSGYSGYVAVEDCHRIGETLLIRPLGTQKWERVLVTDCSGDKATSRWMIRNNILLEVDYLTAKRWKTVGRGIRIEIGLRVNAGIE